MNNIKIYKMDDYDYVVANNIKEAIEFYTNEMSIDEDELDIKECNIDKEGMWIETMDKKDLEKLKNIKEIIYRTNDKIEFGSLMKKYNKVYKFTSFREVIKQNGEYIQPYIIATIDW